MQTEHNNAAVLKEAYTYTASQTTNGTIPDLSTAQADHMMRHVSTGLL